ncbi:Rad1 DNA repair protein [Spraguea lophii 42_110]|uniref:Rad1 DNA repair protein n=1 Tax=Spraguea lophii (strain 42_110) TaxID=1358809 RepID=S7WA96_SPRLO|nr:Rad1 DNA repair protein [Spraguea lophii 42_110]
MLPYEREILEVCNNKSYILISACGLGVETIILQHMLFYMRKEALSFVINTCDIDDEYFEQVKNEKLYFFKYGVPPGEKRREMYKKGGVYVISSVILIGDILNNIVNVESISSIFVGRAENLKENSTEAFIFYLVKKINEHVLIKAYSDNPFLLSTKIFPLENLTNILKVENIFLYPRFKDSIINSLPKDSEMIEISFKLSKNIEKLQVLTYELLNGITNEIKRNTKMNDFETDNILIENYHKLFKRNEIFKNDKKMIKLFRVCKIMKKLTFLLLSVNAHLFPSIFLELVDDEINSTDKTWITLTCTHLIIEEIENMKGKRDKINKIIDDSDEIQFTLDFTKNGNNGRGGIKNDAKLKTLKELIEKNKDKNILILSSESSSKFTIEDFMDIKFHQIENINFCTHTNFRFLKDNYEIIILLEPCLSSIRKIERYVNSTSIGILTYILFFRNTLEEENYLREIRGEKEIFEKLINEKSNIPLKLSMEEIILEDNDEEYKIIVDYRELKSTLPFTLYKARNNIAVSMLDVGDYILGEDLSVERKNIYDFISSLNGRLYLQTKRVIHKYKKHYLLLEFNENRRMCLSDYINFKTENFKNSIISKLTYFIMKFPNVRLIWSNQLKITAKIFRGLQNRSKRIVDEGCKIFIDPMLSELLLNVKGINPYNLSSVLNNFKNLKELANTEEKVLEKILGRENGKLVYEFFNK